MKETKKNEAQKIETVVCRVHIFYYYLLYD